MNGCVFYSGYQEDKILHIKCLIFSLAQGRWIVTHVGNYSGGTELDQLGLGLLALASFFLLPSRRREASSDVLSLAPCFLESSLTGCLPSQLLSVPLHLPVRCCTHPGS